MFSTVNITLRFKDKIHSALLKYHALVRARVFDPVSLINEQPPSFTSSNPVGSNWHDWVWKTLRNHHKQVNYMSGNNLPFEGVWSWQIKVFFGIILLIRMPICSGGYFNHVQCLLHQPHKENGMPIFIAELFTVTKTWK